MAQIELRGKYAVGAHRYAQVDDADFHWLNQWRWKAKWNGSHSGVYAVRNDLVNGKHITYRMHRMVMGLAPNAGQEIDHINHDTLDNRRANLRVVTRKVNANHRRTRTVVMACRRCGLDFVKQTKGRLANFCVKCSRESAYTPSDNALLMWCTHCSEPMFGKMPFKKYCSNTCRWRVKEEKAKAKRAPRPPSRQERLLNALQQSPATMSDLTQRIGMGISDVRRFMPQLVRDGLVRVVERINRGGRRGRRASVYARA